MALMAFEATKSQCICCDLILPLVQSGIFLCSLSYIIYPEQTNMYQIVLANSKIEPQHIYITVVN